MLGGYVSRFGYDIVSRFDVGEVASERHETRWADRQTAVWVKVTVVLV